MKADCGEAIERIWSTPVPQLIRPLLDASVRLPHLSALAQPEPTESEIEAAISADRALRMVHGPGRRTNNVSENSASESSTAAGSGAGPPSASNDGTGPSSAALP